MKKMEKSKKVKIQQTVLLAAGAASIFATSLVTEYLPVSEHVSDVLFAAFLALGVALVGWAMKKEPNTEQYCCCGCSNVYVPEGNYHLGTRMKTQCPHCGKKTTHVFIPKETA